MRDHLLRGVLAGLVAHWAASSVQAGQVIYVRSTADGANNGTSWTDAYSDLQSALTAAVSGDQIWVAKGIYRPSGPNGNRGTAFSLKSSVALYGGFAGNETSVDQRRPAVYETILSADLNGDDGPNFENNHENSYTVVCAEFSGSLGRLDGFTITGGNADGRYPDGCPRWLDVGDLDGTSGFVLKGISTGERCGQGVASAGDFNGDGIPDLAIGASAAEPAGRLHAGRVYVLFGRSGLGSGGSVDLSLLDGTNGLVINGAPVAGFAGAAVSAAGDVNDDGYGDLLIGAPSAYLADGEAYVVFGGPAVGTNGAIDLGTLNGADGFAMRGLTDNDRLGNSLSQAGDVNDDGIDDLIVGAYVAGTPGQGQAYVVFGRAGLGAGGRLNLSSLNGTNGFTISGIDADDWAGWRVSAAGDVNADGRADLLVSALYGDSGSPPHSGQTYIVFGTPGLGAGGTLDLSALDGTNGFAAKGINQSDLAGYAASGAGDFNADGISDIVIGATGTSGGGEVYIIFGQEGIGAGGSFSLSSLNGANGVLVDNGGNGLASMGCDVSAAGDVNGDGFADALISATGENPSRTYVLFGGPDVGKTSYRYPDPNIAYLNGSNGYRVNGRDGQGDAGYSVSELGDVNVDGINDFIMGAPGADPDGRTNAGEAYVILGHPSPTYCGDYGIPKSDGGGMRIIQSRPTLANCRFLDNVAAESGGALRLTGDWVSSQIINCTFSGNKAGYGGGITSSAANPTLVNCTFYGNSATTSGGGIRSYITVPTLTNCILWGNTGSQITGSATVTYSCIQDGWAGTGNISTDPLFVNAGSGNLRLQAASPCRDVGNNLAVPAEVTVDLDGHPRIMNGIVDIGAYEYVFPGPFDFNQDGKVDVDDRIIFESCASGPGVARQNTTVCQAADHDHDNDVDQADFGLFQRCISGNNVPADPACAG